MTIRVGSCSCTNAEQKQVSYDGGTSHQTLQQVYRWCFKLFFWKRWCGSGAATSLDVGSQVSALQEFELDDRGAFF